MRGYQHIEEFNPNALTPKGVKPQIWATFIPRRSPQFKMYTERGHALSSMSYSVALRDGEVKWGGGVLYRRENETEQWTEIFRVQPGSLVGSCDCPDTKTVHYPDGMGGSYERQVRNYKNLHWVGLETDTPSMKLLCTPCFRARPKARRKK